MTKNDVTINSLAKNIPIRNMSKPKSKKNPPKKRIKFKPGSDLAAKIK